MVPSGVTAALPLLPETGPTGGSIVKEVAPVISQASVVVSPIFIRFGSAWKALISSDDAVDGLTCEEPLSEGEVDDPVKHEPDRIGMDNIVIIKTGIKIDLVRVVIILNTRFPHFVTKGLFNSVDSLYRYVGILRILDVPLLI